MKKDIPIDELLDFLFERISFFGWVLTAIMTKYIYINNKIINQMQMKKFSFEL